MALWLQHFACGLALVALAARVADAVGYVVCPEPSGQICIQSGTPDPSGSSVTFTIMTKIANGWTAFGLGTSMFGSDLVMLWRNGDGSWTATHRYAAFHGVPPVASPQRWLLVNYTSAPDANGYYAIATARPMQAVSPPQDIAVSAAGAQSWIYAYYQGGVNTASPQYHSARGGFSYDAMAQAPPGTTESPTPSPQPGSAGGAGLARDTAILVHSVCMILSWTVLTQAAIFTARFLKGKLPTRWFNIHRYTFFLVFALTFIGLSMILATQPASVPLFTTQHGQLGLALIVLMVSQTTLGLVIDRLFDPLRLAVPLRDKAHWVLGWALLVIGPWNVFWGHDLNRTSQNLVRVNAAVVALYVVAFTWAQCKWGQQHERTSPAQDAIKAESLGSDAVIARARRGSTGV